MDNEYLVEHATCMRGSWSRIIENRGTLGCIAHASASYLASITQTTVLPHYSIWQNLPIRLLLSAINTPHGQRVVRSQPFPFRLYFNRS
jgi:hypothetical protein